MYLSRQQHTLTHHMAAYEKAYFLSQTGLRGAAAQLQKALDFLNDPNPDTFPKIIKAPPDIKPLVKALFSDLIIPTQDEVEYEPTLEVIDFALKNFDEAYSLTVKIRLKKIGPLFIPPSGSGIIPDVNEAVYHAVIEAKGETGRLMGPKTSCFASLFKELRIVNIVPPVLGKFVLYLREPGSLSNMNQLSDSMYPNQFKNAPMIISAGPSIAHFGLMQADHLQKYLDNVGWIFLGGNQKWNFNLSRGGGNPLYQEGYLKNSEYLYLPVPGVDKIFNPAIVGYFATQSELYKELGTPIRDSSLKMYDSDFYAKSSAINLFGSNAFPSPTLVLGKVTRSWALLQGLKLNPGYAQAYGLSAKYGLFPYLGENSSVFDSGLNWPSCNANSISQIKMNFDGNYDYYKSRMSKIVTEPYNHGILNFLDAPGLNRAKRMLLDSASLSASVKLKLHSSKLKISNNPAYFASLNNNSSFSLFDDRGISLFSGDLGKMSDLNFLYQKAGPVFASGNRFLSQVRRDDQNRVMLGGIARIGTGIRTKKTLLFGPGGGGILLVDGQVTINRGIRVTSPEPVTIVSMNGNITVNTREPIQAALIAMNGIVSLPREFKIEGLIASKQLVLSSLSGLNKRSLEYRSYFDPTFSYGYFRSYRIMNQDDWVFYVR